MSVGRFSWVCVRAYDCHLLTLTDDTFSVSELTPSLCVVVWRSTVTTCCHLVLMACDWTLRNVNCSSSNVAFHLIIDLIDRYGGNWCRQYNQQTFKGSLYHPRGHMGSRRTNSAVRVCGNRQAKKKVYLYNCFGLTYPSRRCSRVQIHHRIDECLFQRKYFKSSRSRQSRSEKLPHFAVLLWPFA